MQTHIMSTLAIRSDPFIFWWHRCGQSVGLSVALDGFYFTVLHCTCLVVVQVLTVNTNSKTNNNAAILTTSCTSTNNQESWHPIPKPKLIVPKSTSNARRLRPWSTNLTGPLQRSHSKKVRHVHTDSSIYPVAHGCCLGIRDEHPFV